MKVFFNNVMKELEERYGKPITLTTPKEKELLKTILGEFEKGKLDWKYYEDPMINKIKDIMKQEGYEISNNKLINIKNKQNGSTSYMVQ